jgi:serine/threonine-protein kinase
MADDPLLALATAIADGSGVDWESAAQSVKSEEDRRLLDELRFIAELHRVNTVPDICEVRQWGPLRIIDKVGSGTFGDVYRAWDNRLDREVALKILRRRERDDEASASRVIEEGRLLARVRHPNVVTVYGAERVNGQVGVWMEFIQGKTLEEELRAHGPIDVEQASKIGITLADALSAIHRAGLIHRDVKAHNVMRDRDGRLVLTDFGAGCELKETDGAAGELAGTPLCVAPEVLAGQAATPQSDIYSVGVLLYHLVTGTYPVRGRSLEEMRAAHARGARVLLHDERPDLPAAFVQVVDRALDPDPQKRYETPDAFGAALTALVESERATTTAPPAPVTRRIPRWAQAVVAGSLLLLVVGVPRLLRTADPPVIAVLPLKNLSSEPESEYFVDGLTDEIISNLSVIDGLAVRSRTSSFSFKNKPRNLSDIGQQLQAGFVVEGSVLRSDERLRVNVQLVRVDDDTALWARRFDGEMKDVFTIQDEISRSIVNELRLKLGRGQRRYNTNLEAYALYLKARALIDPHGGVAVFRQAIELFEQVIAKDPAFAPAHAGLADAWATTSINSSGDAADEAYAKMQASAEKALQLDPLLAEAHAAMGVVLARDREWANAEAAFRRALELNRNLPPLRTSFAISTLFPQGKVEEALRQLNMALSTDLPQPDVRRMLAWVQVSAGRYDEAIDNCRRVLAIDPKDEHSRQLLGRALLQKGQIGEAIAIFERQPPFSVGFLGYAYARSGRRADAERLAAQHTDRPSRLALIYAGLEDRDRTLEALERMAAGKDPRVGIYLTYPEMEVLRGDPRLAAFRKELRLPGDETR